MVRTQVTGLGPADQRLGGKEEKEKRAEDISGSDMDASVAGGAIHLETDQKEG